MKEWTITKNIGKEYCNIVNETFTFDQIRAMDDETLYKFLCAVYDNGDGGYYYDPQEN